MEQTNLVVTPDGKTWDEVTRDTSYMGPSTVLSATLDNAHISSSNPVLFDEFRGINATRPSFNKNVAIAYDRFIILENGLYQVDYNYYNNQPDTVLYIMLNTTTTSVDNGIISRADAGDQTTYMQAVWDLKRGDWIYLHVSAGGSTAMHGNNSGYQQLNIRKLD